MYNIKTNQFSSYEETPIEVEERVANTEYWPSFSKPNPLQTTKYEDDFLRDLKKDYAQGHLAEINLSDFPIGGKNVDPIGQVNNDYEILETVYSLLKKKKIRNFSVICGYGQPSIEIVLSSSNKEVK